MVVKGGKSKLMRRYSLKALRVDSGMSLEEAADKIGVSKYTLYNYEHFKTQPNSTKIKRILEVYRVGIDEVRFTPNRKEKLAMKKDENCNE